MKALFEARTPHSEWDGGKIHPLAWKGLLCAREVYDLARGAEVLVQVLEADDNRDVYDPEDRPLFSGPDRSALVRLAIVSLGAIQQKSHALMDAMEDAAPGVVR